MRQISAGLVSAALRLNALGCVVEQLQLSLGYTRIVSLVAGIAGIAAVQVDNVEEEPQMSSITRDERGVQQ